MGVVLVQMTLVLVQMGVVQLGVVQLGVVQTGVDLQYKCTMMQLMLMDVNMIAQHIPKNSYKKHLAPLCFLFGEKRLFLHFKADKDTTSQGLRQSFSSKIPEAVADCSSGGDGEYRGTHSYRLMREGCSVSAAHKIDRSSILNILGLLNNYLVDFSNGLLKKCVNLCRDKSRQNSTQVCGENVKFTLKL